MAARSLRSGLSALRAAPLARLLPPPAQPERLQPARPRPAGGALPPGAPGRAARGYPAGRAARLRGAGHGARAVDALLPTAEDLAPALGPTHKAGGTRRGPTGPLGPRGAVGEASPDPYLGDLGFAGAAWQAHWRADYGARVLTKAPYAAPAAGRGRAAPR